jgi:predicted Rossmann-fold nucleotide-binding protein
VVGNLPADGRPLLAVFASDKGPGDAERASIMTQAGTLMARHGARIVCLVDGSMETIPLVTSARAAGGDVLILADEAFHAPPALAEVRVERIEDPETRVRRIGEMAQAFVGLPGSLASVAALYRAWQSAGAGASKKPVILLNHHRAFESMRGFAADIISHSVSHADRIVTFTDNVDDLWNKIAWSLNVTA